MSDKLKPRSQRICAVYHLKEFSEEGKGQRKFDQMEPLKHFTPAEVEQRIQNQLARIERKLTERN